MSCWRRLLGVPSVALSALLLSWNVEGVVQGALKLDSLTFDKVLALPGHTFMVKIDQSYAYGDKEDEFKTLCKLSHSVPNFLVAEVPIQEYGDKENDDLRERFQLTKADFPAYFLFNEANKGGLRYTGAIKADEISAWLRKSQIKLSAIGTIGDLDDLAEQFMKDKSPELILKASQLAESQYSTDRKAGMYIKIMQKVAEKGEAYVSGEMTRVSKILAGKVTAEKEDELRDKMKILRIFAAKDEL